MHQVRIPRDVQPVASKLCRLPLAVHDEVSKEVQWLLQPGVTELITASEWVSPIVVTRMKGGEICLSVDLRAPNQTVIPDCFPLPSTKELLNSFHFIY